MNAGQAMWRWPGWRERDWAVCEWADPVEPVAVQRHELLRRLGEAQRAVPAKPDGSTAGLLLEGVALRLQADLRWLEACERVWSRDENRI